MDTFQVSKHQALNQNNSNKFIYTLGLLGKEIVKLTVDTKIQHNGLHKGQYFEIYIEDFAFDYNIVLVDEDKTLTNIPCSQIKYLTFHSSSVLNIHLIQNNIFGQEKFIINFNHSIKRNQINLIPENQSILGFFVSYENLFRNLGTKINDLPKEFIDKMKNDSCIIALNFGDIFIDFNNSDLYDYVLNIENSKFSDDKKLQIVICESCDSKYFKTEKEVKDKNSDKNGINKMITNFQLEAIKKQAGIQVGYDEIFNLINSDFLTTPFGCNPQANLPSPFPLFITKV
jgi:hypothetical protein